MNYQLDLSKFNELLKLAKPARNTTKLDDPVLLFLEDLCKNDGLLTVDHLFQFERHQVLNATPKLDKCIDSLAAMESLDTMIRKIEPIQVEELI